MQRIDKKFVFGTLYSAIFVMIILLSSFFVQAGNIMTVEANIFNEGAPQQAVSVQVPDFISLGNVSNGGISDEIKVTINNTGTTNISVTPQLADENEEIFSYLYFRTRKSSSNPDLNIKYRIGDYHLSISAPSSSGMRSEYFYMSLDLRNFTEDLGGDLIGHQADVIFVAVAQ
jgi:hypothetical protein